MKIGTREFDLSGNTYIMGILNVTPDSFSDGGKFNTLENAKKHVLEMLEEGVDIIDVGGESTRPGYELVSDEEEIARVVPVIKMIRSISDIPISIDTYKPAVARSAIEAGADLLNDISCLKDKGLLDVLKETGCAYCLMHNRDNTDYDNFMQDVLRDLSLALEQCEDAGIAKDKIMIDPGVGFAKNYEQNLEIIKHLDMLSTLGYPVLLGTSRKSVIGLTLDLPADQRVEGTLATTAYGLMHGCNFVRVHDVKENVRFIKMMNAIARSK